MIETRQLSFVVPEASQSPRFLIENASVSLPPGTFTAVVGPSGCGKSTFLKILSGIIPVSSGCVVLGEPGYYGRFGFKAASGLVYPGPPSEFFMALPFKSFVPQGVVAYHEAFAGEA